MIVFLAAGCNWKKNPYYCPGAPDNNCTEDAAPGSHACTNSAQCLAPTGICDLQSKLCVECTTTQASACSGTRPVCGADDGCRGCLSHAECPGSGACLPDGSCAIAADVAYIAPGPAGTDNAMCSKESPCTTVAKALATGRRYLKLQGTTDEAVTIKDQVVIVLAEPGAMLTRTSNGNILVIDGTSDVQISDLAINGASGTGAGISLPSGGSQSLTLRRVTMSGNNGTNGAITASGGTVNIYQSTIASNSGMNGAITAAGSVFNIYQSTITGNSGGGVSLSATSFDLENNIIAKNGSVVTAYGGVLINQLGSGAHTLEFNTIAQNGANTRFTTNMTYQLMIQPISSKNNIVYNNTDIQINGTNCT